MGLDMYLNANKLVSGFKHAPESEQDEYSSILRNLSLTDIKSDAPWVSITACVMYWRKSNHIHKWFVDNVQAGEDQCIEYKVTREQLEALMDKCLDVINNKEKAAEILPTQAGFFFGSTDYGQWYFDDIKETLKGISSLLNNEALKQGWVFTYRSSW